MNILQYFKYASELYRGQVDKAGFPMIEHATRVFLAVLEAGGDRDQQIAALFHDVVEDKLATLDYLRQSGLSAKSLTIIDAVSQRDVETYTGFIMRVAEYLPAVLVKICDVQDNMDEGRLLLLDWETADRLRKKYAGALNLLLAARAT